jgi:hypothetical protein
MCQVIYQEDNLEPKKMLSPENGFVSKIIETPGLYVIQTDSKLNIGSASMTIRM